MSEENDTEESPEENNPDETAAENDTEESVDQSASERIEFEEELDPFEDEEQLREDLYDAGYDEETIDELVQMMKDADVEMDAIQRRLQSDGVTIERRTEDDVTFRTGDDDWGAGGVEGEYETFEEAGFVEETSESPDESLAEGELTNEFDDPDATESIDEIVEGQEQGEREDEDEDERPRHRRR